MSTQDQTLIDECLSGRNDAFSRLVVRYQERLYNTLVVVLGSADDAREITQDAFVHAYKKLNTFRGNSAFYSWLFRIAMNAAISRKRKHSRDAASIDAARENTGFEPIDSRPDMRPSHALEVSERRKLVRTALDKLPQEYRTALVLKEMEDLSYEEIADILQCPIGTVRSRIYRARKELREKLRVLFKEETF